MSEFKTALTYVFTELFNGPGGLLLILLLISLLILEGVRFIDRRLHPWKYYKRSDHNKCYFRFRDDSLEENSHD